MGFLRACLASLIALSGLTAAPSVAAPSEYQLKAVFLFNFAQFVEWPAQAFAAADSPFVIAVVGEDPFGAELDTAVRGETVMGHPLEVKRYQKVRDLEPCHILFISSTKLEQLDKILTSLDRSAVLTVSDIDRAAERGAMIQFASERNRLHLRINVEAAKAAGLTLSSKLLRPAEIVGERQG